MVLYNTINKEEFKCIYCNSKNILRNGTRRCKRRIKQRYICKNCKRTFIEDKDFEKLKASPKTVTVVMDLYYKGISLRKIKDHLKQFYALEVHHETLRRWIVKFTRIMVGYTDKITPVVSDTWHVDEQVIKSKGKHVWVWNSLDSETRFLLATKVTEKRSIKDARKVLRKSKKTAEYKPEFIVTDGLFSYEKAISREFHARRLPKTHHIRLAKFEDKVNNNLIERYHSTFRERDKVMRGFKGNHNAQFFSEGFRMYYNYLRPHQGLDGMTPAQMAGIDFEFNGGNRWLQLIRVANGGLVPTTVKRVRKTGFYKYTLEVYKENGEPYEDRMGKFQKGFNDLEKAKEFIEFYKLFYPKWKFKLE